MFRILLFLSLLHYSVITRASDSVIDKEFTNFYNSEKLVSNKCGLNIKHFLSYLKDQGIDLTGGYIVSIHEDYGMLNHFMGRWGRKETYENGVTYNRSNWYFHVFAVINNMAYDFSHENNYALPLKDYLTQSYLPKFTTNSIFLMGKLDREKTLKSFLNVKMKVYPLKDYEEKMGPSIYEGHFHELFTSIGINIPAKELDRNIENIPQYSKNSYGSFKLGDSLKFINHKYVDTFNNVSVFDQVSLQLLDTSYAIEADPTKLCQGLGFAGSAPFYTKISEVVIKDKKHTELFCSLYPQRETNEIGLEDTKCSFRYVENDQHFNKKVLKQVGCTSFDKFILNK